MSEGDLQVPGSVPLDADDTRGAHFTGLLSSPVTLSITATVAVAAFVGLTLAAGIAVGAGGAAATVLLVLLIVFVIASSKAKEDFFGAYAAGRGLNRVSRGMLPPSTPLLRKGERRHAEQVMNGTLPGGLPGAIALYTYEERHTDSEGHEEVETYNFTVVMHDIPAAGYKASEAYCQRRAGFRFMDSAEDVFRHMNRLELESDALDHRYEIFYGANDSETWMKQLYSPTFIVWLAEQAPNDFAWEFAAGSLCVNTKGHRDSAAELDELCKAAAMVARRLADEASE